jgi:hypothetical protein
MVLESHKHEHSHLSVLVSGTADVTVDGKTERMTGYRLCPSPRTRSQGAGRDGHCVAVPVGGFGRSERAGDGISEAGGRMKKIELVTSGVNVVPIYWALQSHPELWNQHTARTEDPASPHHGLDDIWARFGDPKRAQDGSPHDSFWYPAADVLGVKQLCHDLMHMVHGVELGGVLITRIPAGAKCKPHTDPGWHARRYEKFAVQITSAPGQRSVSRARAWRRSRATCSGSTTSIFIGSRTTRLTSA